MLADMSTKGNNQSDDEATRLRRAEQLRKRITEITKDEPEEDPQAENPPASNFRDFVHERMREIDDGPKASDECHEPQSDSA